MGHVLEKQLSKTYLKFNGFSADLDDWLETALISEETIFRKIWSK